MGIKYDKTKTHWNYFLAIEQDFKNLSRYIEFSEKNNNTFSIELARIIMAATQEVDVVMKRVCALFGNYEAKSIGAYKTTILNKLPDLIQEKVFIERFGMNSQPWKNWKIQDSPDWWQANNKIKHERVDHFQKANFKNAFNALGGLLIANIYFYKKELEDETGAIKPIKEVIFTKGVNESFMTLDSKYYYDNLVA